MSLGYKPKFFVRLIAPNPTWDTDVVPKSYVDENTTTVGINGSVQFKGTNSKLDGSEDFVYDTTNVLLNGALIANEVTDGTAILSNGTLTNLNEPLNQSDAATKDYVDMSIVALGGLKNVLIVQKTPLAGQFLTITQAIASIIDPPTPENPYVIQVGPGVYIEPTLYLPNNVSIVGSSINTTTIQQLIPNQHLIVMNTMCEISFLNLLGHIDSTTGPGDGYAAIYALDAGEFVQCHKVSIYDFDIGILNESTNADSIFYVEYTDINGNYSYALKNVSTSSFNATIQIENFYTYASLSTIKTSIMNDGANSYLKLISSGLSGDPLEQGIGLACKNGGEVDIFSTFFEGFGDSAIKNLNIGDGSTVRIEGCLFHLCTLYFNILNANTVGFFVGVVPRTQYYIHPSSIFYLQGSDPKVYHVKKKGGDFLTIKEAVDSILDASPTNVYIIDVEAGTFVEDTITLKSGVFVRGTLNGTFIVPTVNTNTIFIGVPGSYLRDLTLTGAYGNGGKAVYVEGNGGLGESFFILNCNLLNNYIGIHVHSTTNITTCVVETCVFSGIGSYCFKVTTATNIFSRLIMSDIFYQRTFASAATHYFIHCSGVNTHLTVLNSSINIDGLTSNTTTFYLDNATEAKIVGLSIKGSNTVLHVPAASNAVNVSCSAIVLNNIGTKHILIEDISTVGFWESTYIYSMVSIPIGCSFYIDGKDQQIITVRKSGGDFSSIVSALASITTNTSTNRFVIDVGSGTFTETEIVMKPFIEIMGQGRATRIVASANNHHLIRACDYSALSSCILFGTGTGYALLYMQSDTGTYATSFIGREILFGTGGYLCKVYSDLGESNVILMNCRYGGTATFEKGFFITNNNNSVAARLTIVGCTSQNFTSPLPSEVVKISGENCKITINGLNIINDGIPLEASTTALWIENGSEVNITSLIIKGFETGIKIANNGLGCHLLIPDVSIHECTTDIVNEHATSYGSISASANRLKISSNALSPLTLFITDVINSGVAFSGPFYYNNLSYGNVTDISQLISNNPTMGLIKGGNLSISSGLILAISEGFGYTNNGISPSVDLLKYQTWPNSTLTLPANSNDYVFLNYNGVLSHDSLYPNTRENILFGKVATSASDIEYIQKIPIDAHHYSNPLDKMIRKSIGAVFSTGCIVYEYLIRRLQVTTGLYYYGNNEFIPDGGIDVPFNIFYRSATPGIYVKVSTQYTVPNTHYDDGTGTLNALTASYYTSHLLLLLGGPSEQYMLVYGTSEHAAQVDAETNIPVLPSFMDESFVKIAIITVQEGSANIVSILDERPRIGFSSAAIATGGITSHSALTDLSANDHPQYLLRSGGAAMNGNLDLNGNSLTNVNLINSIDYSAHASRHAFNGSDPLPVALVGDITELSDSVASAGINNTKIPRADHQHPHGNRGGGSLHAAVIASGASGFMTGADKAKLDGIESGATNTTLTNTAPVNVTKATSSVGVSTEVARADHKHDITTAAPSTTLLTTTTNTEGSATSLSRSDHTHAISVGVPVTQNPGQSNTQGNATSFAASDHLHNIPTASAIALNADSSTGEGASTSFARSNHSHSIATGVVSQQSITTAAAGTSSNLSRADHIHSFLTAAPVSINSVNLEGTSTAFARANHVHAHGTHNDGTMHAVVTTGTSGVAGFMSAVDKTKLDSMSVYVASTTAPSNVSKSTATAGVSSEVSRVDHKHDISTAAPTVNITTNSVNSEGVATSLSRSDHTHTITTGIAVQQLPDQVNAAGSSTGFAKSDHIHNIPSGTASTLSATTTNSQGVAASFALSDHLHTISTGVVSQQSITTASAGTSSNLARADHIHSFLTAAPVTISSANVEGTATSFARSDHVHAHGTHNDGTFHAVVTTGTSGVAGFMSAVDKTKLDSMSVYVASTTAPSNVTKAAASAGVSAEVSRVDHKHDISTAAPSTNLSATTTNSEGTATSMSRSDHSHALTTGAASQQLPDQVNAVGTSANLARADHIHNIPSGTAVTLSATTTNIAGTAASFALSDHLHTISTGAAAQQLPDQVNAVGTSANLARADHIHNIPSGTASTLSATTTNTKGVAASFALSDHLHTISTGVVSQQLPDQTNATGTSSNLARADHIHNIPSGTASTLSATTTNTKGVAASFALSDHLHTISTGVVSQQSITTASAGTSSNLARADHVHSFLTAAPVTISSANVEGTSASFARADHQHDHGNLGGGTLHSVVSTLVAGFMSAADKITLDSLGASAPSNLTPATITATVTATSGVSTELSRADHKHDISTATAVSLVPSGTNSVGTSASLARADHTHYVQVAAPVTIGTANADGTAATFARSDHVHLHGNQTDGNYHAVVIAGGANGFMSGTDKTKLDGIASSASANPVLYVASTVVASHAATTNVAALTTPLGITVANSGNYLVQMETTVGSATATARIVTVQIFMNGTRVPAAFRTILTPAVAASNAASNANFYSVSLNVTTSVGAGNVVDLRASVSAASTLIFGGRSITITKI